MSQIKNKFIESASGSTVTGVDGLKFRLQNNQALRARNAANSADVTLLSLSASDVITMGGLLSMGSNRITNVTDPSGAQDAATKNYVDTNFANVTLAAVGSSPNANAATLTGQVLNLEPASASFPGVVTTAAQTFAGAKTFNSNILSGVDGGPTIGSFSGNKFASGYFNTEVGIVKSSGGISFSLYDSISPTRTMGFGANFTTPVTLPSGSSAIGYIRGQRISGDNSFDIAMFTENNTISSANPSGSVRIETGNKTTGTGNSGDISLQTGTSSGGSRGDITLNAQNINLNAANQISANSKKIVSLADPTSAQDAATKAYVDAVAQGLKPKAAVRVATTGPGTLATSFEDGDTIDGITLATGDRILIKDQTTQSENGIYTVNASGAPTRATDFDSVTPIDEINGAYTVVQFGTANAGTAWVETATVVTVGSSNIVFQQFSAATTIIGGDMISVSGSTVSVDLATTSGLESTNPGNNAGQLRVKLEASNPSLQINGSNELGVKLDAAGSIVSDTSGIKVQVESTTQKINGSNQIEGLKDLEQSITLNGTDITNQYVDLAHAVYGTSASANSISLSVVGGPVQQKTVDYTVSLTGGSGGVTRVTFAGDLATGGAAELVSGDILMVSYSYLT